MVGDALFVVCCVPLGVLLIVRLLLLVVVRYSRCVAGRCALCVVCCLKFVVGWLLFGVSYV